MNQNKDIGLIWEAYITEDRQAREHPEDQPDINFNQRAKAERAMDDHNEGMEMAGEMDSLEQAQAQFEYLYSADADVSDFFRDGFVAGCREMGWSEDDLDRQVWSGDPGVQDELHENVGRVGGSRPINPGFGSDGNEPEKSLADYGLKMVESREDDDDRYWETWEIRAMTREAAEKFGHGPIDWTFRSELVSREDLEQQVLASIERTGKPRFEGEEDPNPWA